LPSEMARVRNHFLNFASDEIKRYKAVHLGKEEVGSFLALLLLKMENHAYPLKIRNIFQNNLVHFIPVPVLLQEHEELVRLLLVSDQLLTADDGDELVVLAFLHSDHFVWLPGLGFEQCDGKIINLLKSRSIINQHLVYFTDQEYVLRLKCQSYGAFQVLLDDRHAEVVLATTLCNIERFLVREV